MKYLTYVVIAVVGASVAAGLYFAGSPSRARKVRFDEQRIGDLQSVQYQVFYFWERNKRLPASLEEAVTTISAGSISVDPETKQPYAYRVLGNNQYELCADFSLPSPQDQESARPYFYKEPYYIGEYSWDHEAGRTCFTRTIDEAQYMKDHPVPAVR